MYLLLLRKDWDKNGSLTKTTFVEWTYLFNNIDYHLQRKENFLQSVGNKK